MTCLFQDQFPPALLSALAAVTEGMMRYPPSAHGRYWYNLHLVLVTDQRYRIRDVELLRSIRDSFLRIAAKKKHAISRLSILSDHLHAALRPQVDESPLDVVFAYLNNLAHLVGRGHVWQDGFYVGTFGEYSTHVLTDREV